MTSLDYSSESDYFQQCKYIHEVELVNMKLQMRILETHLETKDRLLRNLEDIIDEQEARIHNMEEFIQGRRSSYVTRNQILKGISVLSLDFGRLSEENYRLKEALDVIGGDGRGLRDPTPEKRSYPEMARSMQESANLKKLQRIAQEIKTEKNELRQLALDTKDAFSVCMSEVRLLLESKTTDFFRVLVGRYQAEMEKRKKLHNQIVEMNGNIRVFYRIRPIFDKSIETAIEIDKMDNGMVHLNHSSGRKSSKNADLVIPTEFTQTQIFSQVSPIITSCMDGYNVCIFAYGHTGSGKTYTMEGPAENPGINQRAIMQLFETAEEKKGDMDYGIAVSIMEIYNEKIRDLLSESPGSSSLSIRNGEEGLSIVGLQEMKVTSLEQVERVLAKGRNSKAMASTDANISSSRSHVIVRVTVTATNTTTLQTTIV